MTADYSVARSTPAARKGDCRFVTDAESSKLWDDLSREIADLVDQGMIIDTPNELVTAHQSRRPRTPAQGVRGRSIPPTGGLPV